MIALPLVVQLVFLRTMRFERNRRTGLEQIYFSFYTFFPHLGFHILRRQLRRGFPSGIIPISLLKTNSRCVPLYMIWYSIGDSLTRKQENLTLSSQMRVSNSLLRPFVQAPNCSNLPRHFVETEWNAIDHFLLWKHDWILLNVYCSFTELHIHHVDTTYWHKHLMVHHLQSTNDFLIINWGTDLVHICS